MKGTGSLLAPRCISTRLDRRHCSKFSFIFSTIFLDTVKFSNVTSIDSTAYFREIMQNIQIRSPRNHSFPKL